MSVTQEQGAVIDFAKKSFADPEREDTLLVNSVAGAGKTFLLVELVKSIPHKRSMYLAYNKSIATEAASKFPAVTACLTANALAYRNTVRALGLRVGTFSYRDMSERFPYDVKQYYVDTIKKYCLSRHVDFSEFALEEELNEAQSGICLKYLDLMYKGTIECTHDFYMKMFHLVLANGDIDFPKQDILLLDEAGDLNEVTLEIFNLLPAKLKVATGDNKQNIYQFNHTINAFALMEGKGTYFNLTQSFRVSDVIASKIQNFCVRHIDPDMRFSGMPVTDKSITSRAYISRTNGGLISAMIELDAQRIPYSLVRKPAEIFKLPLIFCFAKYQGKITDPGYKHLQDDIDEWHESEDLRKKFKSPLAYIQSNYTFDPAIQSAVRLVMSKGKDLLIRTYEAAKSRENKHHNMTLCTAHSAKGLEFDEVILVDDLNTVLDIPLMNAAMGIPPTEEELQEFNLYYVACSRARKSLQNARHL